MRRMRPPPLRRAQQHKSADVSHTTLKTKCQVLSLGYRFATLVEFRQSCMDARLCLILCTSAIASREQLSGRVESSDCRCWTTTPNTSNLCVGLNILFLEWFS